MTAAMVECVPDSPQATEKERQAARSWLLVQRAQTGDTQAFAEIYDRYVDVVYRFAYYRCGNRQLAEDITSEAFLRALKRIGSLAWQGRDLGAWLVTIARNLVADHFKSGRYRLEVATGEVHGTDDADRTPGPEAATLNYLDNRDLLGVLVTLIPHQRQVLELRFLCGLSMKETAGAMGLTVGAVKTLQFRAVRSLGRALPDGFVR